MDNYFFPVSLLAPAVGLWAYRYWHLAQITRLASSHRDRLVLYLAPAVCLTLLGLFLAGREVPGPSWRGHSLLLCFAAGALVLTFAEGCFPYLGLSPLNDVAERRNRSAGWAIGGALLGVTLAFGGAAGDTVEKAGAVYAVILGALHVVGVFALWGILEKYAGLSEAITVDRDGGTAYRLAAFLPALGLLLGQASPRVAPGTDLLEPILMLVGAASLLMGAMVVESACKKRRSRSWLIGDILIAMVYLSGAGLWVYFLK